MICPLRAKCLALKNGTVRERPVKKAKSRPKRRRIDYAVIESEEHLLMRKRLEKDIWKGLYDFASIENESNPISSETMIDFVEATFPGLAVHTVDSAPHKSYTHLLSHRKIEANFWRLRVKGVCEEGSPYIKVNKDEVADFAVPKLIHRYLSESEIL
jgi:A/G-specific adenine glycosylase